MKSRNKKILSFLIIIILLCGLSTYFVGTYFVNYSLAASKEKDDRNVGKKSEEEMDVITKTIKENEKKEFAKGELWAKNFTDNEVEIEAADKIKLKGHTFLQNNNTDKWIIVLHGYKSNEKKSFVIAKYMYEFGYNVLTIAMRGHKPSEGDYVGMACLDKDDLLDWTKFLVEKYPSAKIIYHGTSMGGATVMMSAGMNKFPNLVGVIDDCGYSNLWDIFSLELKKRFNLPAFPIIHMSSLMSKIKAGYSFTEGNVLDYAKNIQVPTLIVHGTADNFVPFEMSEEMYAALPHENKKLISYADASHADSKFLYIDEYYRDLFEFCEKAFNK